MLTIMMAKTESTRPNRPKYTEMSSSNPVHIHDESKREVRVKKRGQKRSAVFSG